MVVTLTGMGTSGLLFAGAAALAVVVAAVAFGTAAGFGGTAGSAAAGAGWAASCVRTRRLCRCRRFGGCGSRVGFGEQADAIVGLMRQHHRAEIGCACDGQGREAQDQSALAVCRVAALWRRQIKGLIFIRTPNQTFGLGRPVFPLLRGEQTELFHDPCLACTSRTPPLPELRFPAGRSDDRQQNFCNVTNWTQNVATKWPVCVLQNWSDQKVIRPSQKILLSNQRIANLHASND